MVRMARIKNLLFVTAVTALVALDPGLMQAGHHYRRGYGGGDCGGCASPCNDCTAQVQYQTVERTVMVPQTFTEYRTVNVVQCRNEEQQYNYTIYRRVPETHTVQYQYTVPIFETRTREIPYMVSKPVMTT